MRVLGIDIGTTTISASLWQDGREAAWATEENDSFLPPDAPGAKIQNPRRIEEKALSLLGRFPDLDGVALTGQMHGIVYVNRAGEAVSPLYTWQDQRGANLAAELSEKAGHFLAAGYGLVTHAALLRSGQVPQNAAKLMTVMDYLALRLCGESEIHASNAASLGVFDVPSGRFDEGALSALGMDPDLLPPVAKTARAIGKTRGGATVVTAIGDNQASFLGALDGEGVLLNLGTGGQISIYSPEYRLAPPCETRPLNGNSCLLTGSLLCGGRAYAILEGFLRSCARLFGCEPDSLYNVMNRLAEEPLDDLPEFTPLFQGSRENPQIRAHITGLTESNFTPAHLAQSLLWGLAEEMYAYYAPLRLGPPARLFGSGNAIRKNPALRRALSRRFGAELQLSQAREEAAFGAACLASKLI